MFGNPTNTRKCSLDEIVEDCVEPWFLRQVLEHIFYSAFKEMIDPTGVQCTQKIAVYHPNLDVLKTVFGGISRMVPAYARSPRSTFVYLSHYKTGRDLTFSKQLEFDEVFYNKVNVKVFRLDYAQNELFNWLDAPYVDAHNERRNHRLCYVNVFILDNLKRNPTYVNSIAPELCEKDILHGVRYAVSDQVIRTNFKTNEEPLRVRVHKSDSNMCYNEIKFSPHVLEQHRIHEECLNMAVTNMKQQNIVEKQTKQNILTYQRTPKPVHPQDPKVDTDKPFGGFRLTEEFSNAFLTSCAPRPFGSYTSNSSTTLPRQFGASTSSSSTTLPGQQKIKSEPLTNQQNKTYTVNNMYDSLKLEIPDEDDSDTPMNQQPKSIFSRPLDSKFQPFRYGNQQNVSDSNESKYYPDVINIKDSDSD